MNSYTTIQVSANIYWGFQYHIENSKIILMSSEEILIELINVMKDFFSIYNLKELEEGISKLNLKFHEKLVIGTINFVCDHIKK
jgi:hypothetical protein